MSTYLVLLRFTEKGARAIRKSPARAAAFRKAVATAGVKVEAQLWTAGAYDGMLVLRAAEERKLLRAVAALGALGNVRTETLRAFDAREFAAIVGR